MRSSVSDSGSMPLLRNVADFRLKSVLGGSPPRRASISSRERRCLKKSRSANATPACESAALAVLHVPHPTQWYSATSAITHLSDSSAHGNATRLPRTLLPHLVIAVCFPSVFPYIRRNLADLRVESASPQADASEGPQGSTAHSRSFPLLFTSGPAMCSSGLRPLETAHSHAKPLIVAPNLHTGPTGPGHAQREQPHQHRAHARDNIRAHGASS